VSLVTFIVPTIGRPELKRAIDSLSAQRDDDWEAVVVFDQNKTVALDSLHDERYWTLTTSKGSAGETRNVGLDWHRSNGGSEWVAFLDDDDVLTPHYVEHLREHADDYPWADVIVFRMDTPHLGIVPPTTGQIMHGTVGISFALKAEIANGYRFVAERRESLKDLLNEDWDLISRLVKDGKQIFISPHIDYIVRDWRSYE